MSIHNFVELYKAAKEEEIKHIFGIEVYVANDMHDKEGKRHHLIILAKNKKGLDNIFKMVSKSNTEGFYYKPRIDFEILKKHSEGLIVSSACLAGEIPRALENNNNERAEEIALKYKKLFGDDFYIEIMANDVSEQYVMNSKLANLARKLDIELVATSDMHYLEKDSIEAHDVMLCIQTGAKVEDNDRFRFHGDSYYFKGEDEIKSQLFAKSVESDFIDARDSAVENTVKIADKCDTVELDLGNLLLPKFEVPEGYTLESHLEERAFKKLFELAVEKDIDMDKYARRLDTELEVINMKGYPAYFLIVEDYVQWAKDNNIIVGPGRGSAAGSLLSYLLGITALDPVKYGLLFERFLNPERTAMPDIDIDFGNRGKVIQYVIDKYGEENVASICNFGTLGAKSAVKDVGRVLGYDYNLMNKEISKAFPDTPGISIKEALEESKELKMYAGQYPKLFDIAQKLEGKPRQLGTHASAVVITPEPVDDYTPLARTKNSQTGEITYVTQTEMHDSEDLGLLKMDFLGLKTVVIIGEAIKFIKNRKDYDSLEYKPTVQNIWDLPLDDKDVYKNIYQKADTNGVFQVESQLFKRLLKKMRPTKFEHIIAILALGRPGPLEAGIVEKFFDRMHGNEKVEYPHPDLEEDLKETYGFMAYQEQVMAAARRLAGFSLGEADILRRGMGKKKIKVLEKMKVKFKAGAKENGHTEEFADEMFRLIEYFAGYGFNKSHSACYALISYATAYLKYHFPAEFYAAIMSVEAAKSGSDSSITDYFSDCYKKKIDILPPDINESEGRFTAVNGRIRLGLNAIDGLGKKASTEIMNERPFKDLDDMYQKVDTRVVNKTAFEALIKAGAMDSFGKNRKQLLADYKTIKEFGQMRQSLFDAFKTEEGKGVFDEPEPTKEEIIEFEMGTIGLSLTYPSEWDFAKSGEVLEVEGIITESKEVKTRKSNKLMAFAKVKTDKNKIKLVVFPDTYRANHDLFQKGFKLKLEGKKDKSNAMLVDKVKLIEGDFFKKAN